MKKLILIIISSCISATCFAGGGWVHKKGDGFFQIGQQFLKSNKLFDGSGNTLPITTIGTYTTSFYGELGLGKRFEVNTYVPFFIRNTLNELVEKTTRDQVSEGRVLNSFGDPTVSLKYGILQGKPFVLSSSIMLGLPLGNLDKESNLPMPTGDGEFNQMILLEAGYSFSNFYGILGAGFNNRTQSFSDEIRYHGEIGYKKKRLLISVKLFGVNSLENGDGMGSASGLFSNDISYLTYGPQIAFYATKKVGILANMLVGSSGKNVLAAPSYTLGVFLDLKK